MSAFPQKRTSVLREKCDDDEDRLKRLARSSFDHLLPAQGSVKTGPRVTTLSRNLAAGSAFAMLVDVWQARSSNPWWRAWECPGNKVRSQREQSAGSLCPNRCPRDCCTSSGCAGACACASGGSGSPIARMSSCSSSRARRWFRTAQIATSTSARWSMSPVACPRRLRVARKHSRSPSKWSGTWRNCCR
jgi:hypothetical protein